MAMEGVPPEQRELLFSLRLTEDAGHAQVVWARVRGYPSWPAQVLSDVAARKKLGKVPHRKDMDVPVMFFGTLEIAWIGRADIVSFAEGIKKGFLAKGKQKNFQKALEQVLEFLSLDKKRKAPTHWWSKAPALTGDKNGKPVSRSASALKHAAKGPKKAVSVSDDDGTSSSSGSDSGNESGSESGSDGRSEVEEEEEEEQASTSDGEHSGSDSGSDDESGRSSDSNSSNSSSNRDSDDEEGDAGNLAQESDSSAASEDDAPKGKAVSRPSDRVGKAGKGGAAAIKADKPSVHRVGSSKARGLPAGGVKPNSNKSSKHMLVKDKAAKADVKAEVKAELKSGRKPYNKAGCKADDKAQHMSNGKAEAKKAGSRAEGKAERKLDQADSKALRQSDEKAEGKPERKGEGKSKLTAEPKPERKAEGKAVGKTSSEAERRKKAGEVEVKAECKGEGKGEGKVRGSGGSSKGAALPVDDDARPSVPAAGAKALGAAKEDSGKVAAIGPKAADSGRAAVVAAAPAGRKSSDSEDSRTAQEPAASSSRSDDAGKAQNSKGSKQEEPEAVGRKADITKPAAKGEAAMAAKVAKALKGDSRGPAPSRSDAAATELQPQREQPQQQQQHGVSNKASSSSAAPAEVLSREGQAGAGGVDGGPGMSRMARSGHGSPQLPPRRRLKVEDAPACSDPGPTRAAPRQGAGHGGGTGPNTPAAGSPAIGGEGPLCARPPYIDLDEQDILKLPIEIRRLAGIKLVKKPSLGPVPSPREPTGKDTPTITPCSAEQPLPLPQPLPAAGKGKDKARDAAGDGQRWRRPAAAELKLQQRQAKQQASQQVQGLSSSSVAAPEAHQQETVQDAAASMQPRLEYQRRGSDKGSVVSAGRVDEVRIASEDGDAGVPAAGTAAVTAASSPVTAASEGLPSPPRGTSPEPEFVKPEQAAQPDMAVACTLSAQDAEAEVGGSGGVDVMDLNAAVEAVVAGMEARKEVVAEQQAATACTSSIAVSGCMGALGHGKGVGAKVEQSEGRSQQQQETGSETETKLALVPSRPGRKPGRSLLRGKREREREREQERDAVSPLSKGAATVAKADVVAVAADGARPETAGFKATAAAAAMAMSPPSFPTSPSDPGISGGSSGTAAEVMLGGQHAADAPPKCDAGQQGGEVQREPLSCGRSDEHLGQGPSMSGKVEGIEAAPAMGSSNAEAVMQGEAARECGPRNATASGKEAEDAVGVSGVADAPRHKPLTKEAARAELLERKRIRERERREAERKRLRRAAEAVVADTARPDNGAALATAAAMARHTSDKENEVGADDLEPPGSACSQDGREGEALLAGPPGSCSGRAGSGLGGLAGSGSGSHKPRHRIMCPRDDLDGSADLSKTPGAQGPGIVAPWGRAKAVTPVRAVAPDSPGVKVPVCAYEESPWLQFQHLSAQQPSSQLLKLPQQHSAGPRFTRPGAFASGRGTMSAPGGGDALSRLLGAAGASDCGLDGMGSGLGSGSGLPARRSGGPGHSMAFAHAHMSSHRDRDSLCATAEEIQDAEAAEALMGMCLTQQRPMGGSYEEATTSGGGVEDQDPQQTFVWPQGEPLLPDQQEVFVPPGEWRQIPPPQYEHLKRNLWVSRKRPTRLHKEEVSVCYCTPPEPDYDESGRLVAVGGCQDGCLNRMSSIHCDPRSCPCGDLCSNKPFHLLKMPKLQTFLTENRGHGIRAMQFVSKGSFIVEYSGEVVDAKELEARMQEARRGGEQHFYIMELGPGLFIDARHKGNIARLLNSSCDPNCETQKWHDSATGEARIGIFARRDIRPGEELTYDYFFEHYGPFAPPAASFQCMCGAKNCRGTMDINPEKRKDLGRRIEVFWDGDGIFYRATVIGYNAQARKHVILYDDGDKERVCLDEVPHRWLDEEAVPPGLLVPAAVQAVQVVTTGQAVSGAVGGGFASCTKRPGTLLYSDSVGAMEDDGLVGAGSLHSTPRGEVGLPLKKRARAGMLSHSASAPPLGRGSAEHQGVMQHAHSERLRSGPGASGHTSGGAGAGGSSAGTNMDSLLQAVQALEDGAEGPEDMEADVRYAPAGAGTHGHGHAGGHRTDPGVGPGVRQAPPTAGNVGGRFGGSIGFGGRGVAGESSQLRFFGGAGSRSGADRSGSAPDGSTAAGHSHAQGRPHLYSQQGGTSDGQPGQPTSPGPNRPASGLQQPWHQQGQGHGQRQHSAQQQHPHSHNLQVPGSPTANGHECLRLEDILGVRLAPCSVPLFCSLQHRNNIHRGGSQGTGAGSARLGPGQHHALYNGTAAGHGSHRLANGTMPQRDLHHAHHPHGARPPAVPGATAELQQRITGGHHASAANGFAGPHAHGAGPSQPQLQAALAKGLAMPAIGGYNAGPMGLLLNSPVLASMPASQMSTMSLLTGLRS